jgi:hypothetical protein
MAVTHVEHAAVVGLNGREYIVPHSAPQPLSSRPPLGSRCSLTESGFCIYSEVFLANQVAQGGAAPDFFRVMSVS